MADGGEASLGTETKTTHSSEEGLIVRDGGDRAIDIIGYIYFKYIWLLTQFIWSFENQNMLLLLQYTSRLSAKAIHN